MLWEQREEGKAVLAGAGSCKAGLGWASFEKYPLNKAWKEVMAYVPHRYPHRQEQPVERPQLRASGMFMEQRGRQGDGDGVWLGDRQGTCQPGMDLGCYRRDIQSLGRALIVAVAAGWE